MSLPTRREYATEYEIRVLRALAEHGTIGAAAAALEVSSHTVDGCLDRLRNRTGLRYLPQLIAWAARQGWLGDGGPGDGSSAAGDDTLGAAVQVRTSEASGSRSDRSEL